MSDEKKKGPALTEQERETVFAPHDSPDNQADGDTGTDEPKPSPRDQADDKKDATDKPSQ